jgi:hypothetical protein
MIVEYIRYGIDAERAERSSRRIAVRRGTRDLEALRALRGAAVGRRRADVWALNPQAYAELRGLDPAGGHA